MNNITLSKLGEEETSLYYSSFGRSSSLGNVNLHKDVDGFVYSRLQSKEQAPETKTFLCHNNTIARNLNNARCYVRISTLIDGRVIFQSIKPHNHPSPRGNALAFSDWMSSRKNVKSTTNIIPMKKFLASKICTPKLHSQNATETAQKMINHKYRHMTFLPKLEDKSCVDPNYSRCVRILSNSEMIDIYAKIGMTQYKNINFSVIIDNYGHIYGPQHKNTTGYRCKFYGVGKVSPICRASIHIDIKSNIWEGWRPIVKDHETPHNHPNPQHELHELRDWRQYIISKRTLPPTAKSAIAESQPRFVLIKVEVNSDLGDRPSQEPQLPSINKNRESNSSVSFSKSGPSNAMGKAEDKVDCTSISTKTSSESSVPPWMNCVSCKAVVILKPGSTIPELIATACGHISNHHQNILPNNSIMITKKMVFQHFPRIINLQTAAAVEGAISVHEMGAYPCTICGEEMLNMPDQNQFDNDMVNHVKDLHLQENTILTSEFFWKCFPMTAPNEVPQNPLTSIQHQDDDILMLSNSQHDPKILIKS